MVRRANVFFNLKKLYKLTLTAMAAIDSEYWTKCIEHMKKEVHHYMLQDRVNAEVPTTMEPATIVENPANPIIRPAMIIHVSWNLKKEIL